MSIDIRPISLRTNHHAEPLGIDDTPRFSWRYPRGLDTQNGFQLRLARLRADLVGDNAEPLWYTKRSTGGVCGDVAYGGPPLDATTRYYWCVRGWDGDGNPTEWSDPTWFETGLKDTPWNADWIGHDCKSTDGPAPAPLLRKPFETPEPVDCARLYLSGLGWHQPWINGEQIGDQRMDPPFVDYEERVPYTVFDVTGNIDSGQNVLGVVLGRGRFAEFTESVWGWNRAPWTQDRPQLCCRLDLYHADGSVSQIATDDTWRGTDGPTRADSLFEGEHYDARAERPGWTEPGHEDDEWTPADVVSSPEGDRISPACPPIRDADRIDAERITYPEEDVAVIDLGQMIAGGVEVILDGPAGHTVEIRHGEALDDNGRLEMEEGGGEEPHVTTMLSDSIQVDRYTCDGNGPATWSPSFTYKGFRYVEVRDYPGQLTADSLTGIAYHSAIDQDRTGTVATEDQLLNRIQKNTRWAILNNYHHQPTDTPTFEKNGWTGDAHLTAPAALYNFDPITFYRKWLEDFADAQRESGEIPPIVPTSDWGYHDAPMDGGLNGPYPAWDAAYPIIAWESYRHTGDRSLLKRHVDELTQLVRYLDTEADGHIFRGGLGDWKPPEAGDTAWSPEDSTLASTAYLYRIADLTQRIASVVDRDEIQTEIGELTESIGTTFNETFFDGERHVYTTAQSGVGYRQTSNVLPLAFDIVPEDHRAGVIRNLVHDVVERCNRHLDTGILGTRHLLPVLSEAGHPDVAYDVATQRTFPSWGYWIEHGATSLFESWFLDARSRNHHMFGSIGSWLYSHITGIEPAAPGFRSVSIAPRIPSELDGARASIETVRGRVDVEWTQTPERIELETEIPSNSQGELSLPADSAGGVTVKSTSAQAGLMEMRMTGDRWEATVPPGDWTIQVEK